MQSNLKQIYKLTAQRTNKEEQAYKDLGNFVFSALYKSLRRPTSLITKLKGVGTWYLRKKRMQEFKCPDPAKKPEETAYYLEIIDYNNKLEMFTIFTERLKEYEEYTKLKQEIRKQRNEFQTLLEPFKRED